MCVISILSSPTWVHGADSVQQLSVNERGSGPTCLTVWERTGEWTDFGVFQRGPPSLWVSYTSGVGACEAPVCVFSILFFRTLVHRADSVQQLSVSGRGSGPTCLAVSELNGFGVFPRGPPSLWVSYTFGFGVCESPVCIFSILSRTWVHGANDVQLSVSARGRLLVHVGLVTVTGTTVSSSYPNNNLTMASELERKRTASKGWATRSANSLKDYLPRDDITKVKLGELISDFDKRLEALDCVQTQVEMSFEDLDALLADIEVSGNYRDSICETRLKALECFEKLSVTNPLEADVTSVTSTGTADVKLPKLSLPKFSGDVLQWQSFWDQFTAVVDSSDIPDISKFSYLRSLLEGEAKQSIQGLSLTSQHYQSARQILTDRFGRKERIIFTHIQTLLNMLVMNKCSVSNLWKLNDDLQSHTRSLEALGICGTQYGVILTPLILSRLPQDVRLEWSREGEGPESDLSYLLKFLEKKTLRRERSQVFKDTVQVSSSVPEARRFKAPPTAAALQTASMNVKPSAPHECGVCGKNHPTDRCFKLLHCNGSERRERVQRAGLCYRCLRKGHIAKGCSSVCSKCNGRHHKLLCGVQSISAGSSPNVKGVNKHVSMANAEISGTVESLSSVKPSASNATETASKVILVGSSARVLLQTARVKVRGARGVTEATILFDTGSDRSYVTSELVGKVGPLWVDSQPIAYSGFGAGNTSKARMRSIFDLILQDEHGSDQSLFATEVPVICAPLVCPEVPQSVLTSFGELSMAWDYTLSSEIKVDILVGLDSYWKFVKPQITGCSVEGLMAQSTVFGWVLFGSVPVSQMTAPVMSHPMLCLTVSEQSVKSFWELESIWAL